MKINKSFTLLEMMIVVAILGILTVIAAPNFITARNTARRNICRNNLMIIGHAGEQYMINNEITTLPTLVILISSEYLKNNLVCPSGDDNYTLDAEDKTVTCPNEHGTYDVDTSEIT